MARIAGRTGDRHTKLVKLLKVALPLVALALLSTIFLVSRTVGTQDAIPYSNVDVQGRAMDPRLTEPTWSGLTSDGARLNIAAAEVRPPAEGRPATISALRADLTTPDGVDTHLQSAAGTYDDANQRVTFSGQVRVHTSTGYDIRMAEAVAELDRTQVTGIGPITGQAPMGQLTAGGMTLNPAGDTGGQYRLDFTGGVKLIYTPAPQP
ncbi:LPS export ABC transporter periplasmic protein LptC [Falsirhodobacter halotolerans]|uniref:LPS export ABC transporter periplasmic protein LptC n=1 Tax=Falsirhodobacter halotolerans TaxID=1146892 RepID=UPI001FD0DD7F|nr:LPS export ABC transporter periplasmic protein LptC [Falsirhodobacter halotolerans]MCJ8138369.1 hypothetical protein [Falsirhodobacter halotolerans]